MSVDYRSLTGLIANQYGLGDWFLRQIAQESGFNPRAVSSAGARGIAQIMPNYHPGVNPDDPVASLHYAANMMREAIAGYGGDVRKALAAYNAGGGSVQRAVARGGENWIAYLPAETQSYLQSILGGGAPVQPGGGAGTPSNRNVHPIAAREIPDEIIQGMMANAKARLSAAQAETANPSTPHFYDPRVEAVQNEAALRARGIGSVVSKAAHVAGDTLDIAMKPFDLERQFISHPAAQAAVKALAPILPDKSERIVAAVLTELLAPSNIAMFGGAGLAMKGLEGVRAAKMAQEGEMLARLAPNIARLGKLETIPLGKDALLPARFVRAGEGGVTGARRFADIGGLEATLKRINSVDWGPGADGIMVDIRQTGKASPLSLHRLADYIDDVRLLNPKHHILAMPADERLASIYRNLGFEDVGGAWTSESAGLLRLPLKSTLFRELLRSPAARKAMLESRAAERAAPAVRPAARTFSSAPEGFDPNAGANRLMGALNETDEIAARGASLGAIVSSIKPLVGDVGRGLLKVGSAIEKEQRWETEKIGKPLTRAMISPLNPILPEDVQKGIVAVGGALFTPSNVALTLLPVGRVATLGALAPRAFLGSETARIGLKAAFMTSLEKNAAMEVSAKLGVSVEEAIKGGAAAKNTGVLGTVLGKQAYDPAITSEFEHAVSSLETIKNLSPRGLFFWRNKLDLTNPEWNAAVDYLNFTGDNKHWVQSWFTNADNLQDPLSRSGKLVPMLQPLAQAEPEMRSSLLGAARALHGLQMDSNAARATGEAYFQQGFKTLDLTGTKIPGYGTRIMFKGPAAYAEHPLTGTLWDLVQQPHLYDGVTETGRTLKEGALGALTPNQRAAIEMVGRLQDRDRDAMEAMGIGIGKITPDSAEGIYLTHAFKDPEKAANVLSSAGGLGFTRKFRTRQHDIKSFVDLATEKGLEVEGDLGVLLSKRFGAGARKKAEQMLYQRFANFNDPASPERSAMVRSLVERRRVTFAGDKIADIIGQQMPVDVRDLPNVRGASDAVQNSVVDLFKARVSERQALAALEGGSGRALNMKYESAATASRVKLNALREQMVAKFRPETNIEDVLSRVDGHVGSAADDFVAMGKKLGPQQIQEYLKAINLGPGARVAEVRLAKELSLKNPDAFLPGSVERKMIDDVQKHLSPVVTPPDEALAGKVIDNARGALLFADASPMGLVQGVRAFSASPAAYLRGVAEGTMNLMHPQGRRLWALQNLPRMRYWANQGLQLGHPMDFDPGVFSALYKSGLPGAKIAGAPLHAMGWANEWMMQTMGIAKMHAAETMLTTTIAARSTPSLFKMVESLPGIKGVANKLGPGWRDAPIEDVARAVSNELNNSIGPIEWAKVGSKPGMLQRLFLLTPSWTRGNIGLVGDSLTKTGLEGFYARWLVQNQLALAAKLSTSISLSLSGEMPDFDPRSSTFLHAKAPWGTFSLLPAQTVMRTMARIVGGGAGSNVLTPDLEARFADSTRFIEGRAGQFPRVMVDVAQGHDFLGKKIDNKPLYIAQSFLPVVAQEALDENLGKQRIGGNEMAQRLTMETLGSTVRPKTPFERERDRLEEITGKNPDEIDIATKKSLRQTDPTLQQIQKDKRNYRDERGDELNQFYKVTGDVKTASDKTVTEFLAQAPEGTPGLEGTYAQIVQQLLAENAQFSSSAMTALGLDEERLKQGDHTVLDQDNAALQYWSGEASKTLSHDLALIETKTDPIEKATLTDEAFRRFEEARQKILTDNPQHVKYIKEDWPAARFSDPRAKALEVRRVRAQDARREFFNTPQWRFPNGKPLSVDQEKQLVAIRNDFSETYNRLTLQAMGEFQKAGGDMAKFKLPTGARAQLWHAFVQKAQQEKADPERIQLTAFAAALESKFGPVLRNPERDVLLLRNPDLVKFFPKSVAGNLRKEVVQALNDPEITRIYSERGAG